MIYDFYGINNPSAYQFQTAIRRIVLHHEVVYSLESNCGDDNISVLNVSSSKKNTVENTDNDDDDTEDFELFKFQNVTIPSNFVNYIIRYISGYIVYKMKLSRSILSCQECFDSVSANCGTSLLTDIKNRGHLSYASENVFHYALVLGV